ncbi:hypothetical protein A5662_14640 [Mycobacteriaceae bacterium 1482268.1]|nr:hypothetical protein A5662_14640 [Mycobacteriaceae bacterium 1482268.1]
MNKLGLTTLGVAVGGLALSLTAGVGVASAAPDLGPAVNSTCNYTQFVAALNAQNPTYGATLDSSPQIKADLQTFLLEQPASPRRQTFATNVSKNPAFQAYLPILRTAFDTCGSFAG